MNIDWAVRAWARSAMNALTPTAPQTVHVTDLIGAAMLGGSECLRLGFAGFEALASQMEVHLEEVVPTLVIPLGSVERIDLIAPTWSEVWSRVAQTEYGGSTDEPPALALVHPSSALLLEQCEEYRCPMTPPPEVPKRPGLVCVAHYRCFRSVIGVASGWDFDRCIYLEAVAPWRAADTAG